LKKNPATQISLAHRLARVLRPASNQSDHREFLLQMLVKNSIGAEIGVYRGDFSDRILRMVHPRELHLIDPWKYEDSEIYKKALYGGKIKNGQNEMDEICESVRARFEPEIQSGRVKIHRDNSKDVLARFPDDYFDWLYIDGNHLYDFVRQDLELSFMKIKPGGYITGDDYLDAGWWQGGVRRAVDEFIRQKPVRVVAIRDDQYVLQR
jgi:hypothetical protein